MRVGVQRGGKSESPFHFQAADDRRRLSPACGRALKARVQQILAPSVPYRSRLYGSLKSGAAVVHMAAGEGAVSMGWANDLPVMNSAMARRSAADCRLAIEIMGPDSMAASTRSATWHARLRGWERGPLPVRGRARSSFVDGRPPSCGGNQASRAQQDAAATRVAKAEIAYRDGFYHVDAVEPRIPPRYLPPATPQSQVPTLAT